MNRVLLVVVGTVLDGLKSFSDYRVVVLPDHPTPVLKKTHTSDPVPFALYGSNGEFKPVKEATCYSEQQAKESGFVFNPGYNLMAELTRS